MRQLHLAAAAGLMCVLVLASCGSDPIATSAAVARIEESTVSFSGDVLPLLESRCVGCHGAERAAGGLALGSYAELSAGSENGPVVVAGDAMASSLVELVVNQAMPKKGPKLLATEVQLLTDWVNQGALDN